MAAAAMNGAVLDTTFNFFFKFKYAHTFDAMLATPLRVRDVAYGEMTWALLRGALYSAAFLVDDGGRRAGALVVGGARGARGPAHRRRVRRRRASAGTTFMRSWVDFDYVNLGPDPDVPVLGVFFPLSQYPDAVQVIVQVTPLYQGVVLERALVLGHVEWTLLLNAALPRRHGLARRPHRHRPPPNHAPALTHPPNLRQCTSLYVAS